MIEGHIRLNFRVFYWHLQIDDCWKWHWTYNEFHKQNKLSNGWIRLYTFNLFMKRPKCGCSRDQAKVNNAKEQMSKIPREL